MKVEKLPRAEVGSGRAGSSARKRTIWVALAAAASCGLAAAALVTAAAARRPASAPTTASAAAPMMILPGTAAPGFSLRDQFGHRVELSGFRGEVVALTFIDSRCNGLCPLTAEVLRSVQERLGPSAAGLQLLAINANPVHTAISDVMHWSRTRLMVHHWEFVTGPAGTLKKVWAAYDVSSVVGPSGGVTHVPAIYVIDTSGRERAVTLVAPGKVDVPAEADALMRTISPLLPPSS
jgi:cytochrome oxidase Cu insertion factor (SCO1/SenC/PrrC family)